jgi:phytoene dehydrogenase-like protein
MVAADVAIIGGGLAGLTASAILARSGKRVVVLERAANLGGRARSLTQGDFVLNLGAHALYNQGLAARTYQELGLVISGGEPIVATGSLSSGGALHPIPFSPRALLRSRLFGWREKWELLRLLQRLTKLNPIEFQGQSIAAWIERHVRSANVKSFINALIRLSCYCNDLELLDAGLAIAQFQLSLGGVLYLDRGWQTIVDGLVEISQQFGAKLFTAKHVIKIDRYDSVVVVKTNDGETIETTDLILTTDPQTANKLLNLEIHSTPIRAACLDLTLRQLPLPDRQFALGLDLPYYYSVHSAYARLAPAPGAVVHVARYLRHDERIPAAELRSQLEAWLDTLQPNWQREIIHARFMPDLAVAQDLPRLVESLPQVANVHFAGDWVGAEGMLSDRAIASAVRATEKILQIRSSD